LFGDDREPGSFRLVARRPSHRWAGAFAFRGEWRVGCFENHGAVEGGALEGKAFEVACYFSAGAVDGDEDGLAAKCAAGDLEDAIDAGGGVEAGGDDAVGGGDCPGAVAAGDRQQQIAAGTRPAERLRERCFAHRDRGEDHLACPATPGIFEIVGVGAGVGEHPLLGVDVDVDPPVGLWPVGVVDDDAGPGRVD